MITKKVIEYIYRKYRRRPSSIDDLDTAPLLDEAFSSCGISIDNNIVTIAAVDPRSPFHVIDLNRVYGIERFEHEIAIVFHSSIMFLTADAHISIHVKEPPHSLWEKLRWWFSK